MSSIIVTVRDRSSGNLHDFVFRSMRNAAIFARDLNQNFHNAELAINEHLKAALKRELKAMAH